MILMSYDGSADSQAAIDRLAHVMPGATVTVLTVWEPFMQTMARTGMGMGMGMGVTGGYCGADAEALTRGSVSERLETATDRTARATAAGLVAKPWIEQRDGDVATRDHRRGR